MKSYIHLVNTKQLERKNYKQTLVKYKVKDIISS